MQSGKAAVEEALSRAGRYQKMRAGIEVKESIVGDGEAHQRFILVRNPQEEARDRAKREEIIKALGEELKGISRLDKGEHPRMLSSSATWYAPKPTSWWRGSGSRERWGG